MTGETRIVDWILADFLTTILPNIVGEPTRESIIELHQIIISKAAYIASNLGGGLHGRLELTMDVENYLAQTVHTFAPPHNLGDYLPTMGTTKEQTLRMERLWKYKALFR